jgi:hypothetical protein
MNIALPAVKAPEKLEDLKIRGDFFSRLVEEGKRLFISKC